MNRQKIESKEEKENTNLEFLAKEGQLKDKGEQTTYKYAILFLLVNGTNWKLIYY